MDISNVTYERKKGAIVYVSLPQINELCCTICKLDFIEVHESSTKTNFHWTTMKCRLLIYLVTDVIASPISGTEKYIFVITRKAVHESGKLEKILRYLKLVYQGQRPITTEIYKTCFLYTIQTKIAPLWNKVGQYFLQGKQFFTSVEPISALKIDILFQEKDICLLLHTESVNIPFVKLEDFVPSSVLSHFLADPKGYIDLSHYDSPFVYVLPSTKRGRVLSVFKEFPMCTFKDYDQMRRHWKNMYGYSLPKNKDGIFYLEIKFPVPKSHSFIYPNICVASDPLNIIPNKNEEYTINRFVFDVLRKLPTICDTELKLSKHTFHNKKTVPTNIISNALSQNKQLITPLKRKYDSTSTVPLEFPTNYVNELVGNAEITSEPLKTQLDEIHTIHNTLQCNANRADFNNKNIEHNERCLAVNIIETQITKEDCNEAGISRNSNVKTVAAKQETISKYFKICKPLTNNSDKIKLTTYQNQKDLTLKGKLLLAKPKDNSEMCGQEMDQYIDVEKMAKDHKLHQIKNNILSEWLTKHLIPHNPKGKKEDLINKILSHMRNTQILKHFRV
ncbi:uncharacterized protein C18orf63 isoform X2 [Megalopta genalis]|uniref:uncharacterized protein C18orf63 isoform X2 n=1 Tax=Megalopta genalis TaxID=115081 RepID=UPI003FD34695